MKYFYKIWFVCYNFLFKYGYLVEHFFFLSNNNLLYRINSIKSFTFVQNILFVSFYTPLSFRKLHSLLKDGDNVYDIRIHRYPRIHNFFVKEMSKHKTNMKADKYLYSCIKTTYSLKSFLEDNTFIDLNTILTLNNIKKNVYWKDVFVEYNFNTYLSTKKTKVLLNVNTIDGFIKFLSNKNKVFTLSKLNDQDEFFNKMVFTFSPYAIKWPHKLIKKNFKKTLKNYTKFYKSIITENNADLTFIDIFSKLLEKQSIVLEKNFKNFYKILYPIKFKPTDATQFFKEKAPVVAMFMRKNKIFNKGRYSRNRQLYRTGVYWCLWLNIINVFGLYYYFYRFVFNFGYFYLPLLLLILSIFGSRLIKYRFYNPMVVINEFSNFMNILINFFFEILVNFCIRSKDLTIKLAKYIYKTVLVYFS